MKGPLFVIVKVNHGPVLHQQPSCTVVLNAVEKAMRVGAAFEQQWNPFPLTLLKRFKVPYGVQKRTLVVIGRIDIGVALRLHADDRCIDRPLVLGQGRLGAVDDERLRTALERTLDHVADGAKSDDGYADRGLTSSARLSACGFCARPCRSASSSVSFIVKLWSASGNAPLRTSASNALSAASTWTPMSA